MEIDVENSFCPKPTTGCDQKSPFERFFPAPHQNHAKEQKKNSILQKKSAGFFQNFQQKTPDF